MTYAQCMKKRTNSKILYDFNENKEYKEIKELK